MEYIFDVTYDLPAMAAMSKASRKCLQEERDRKSRIIGWLFLLAGAVILLTGGRFGFQQFLAAVILALFALYLLFPDTVNGAFALRKIPSAVRTAVWSFQEGKFEVTTSCATDSFRYERIYAIVEVQDHLVLFFESSQAQVFCYRGLRNGCAKDFRRFLRKHTGLTIQTV